MTEPALQPAETQQPVPPPNNDSSPLRELCAKLHAQVTAFIQADVPTARLKAVQAQTRRSLSIIQEALDKYDLSALSLSYNGGKDCLVLLILYLSLLSTHAHLPALLPAIYIPPTHPFPAVDSFVASSSTHYRLSLSRYQHPSMRLAFTHYLTDNPSIRAIFVGTRRTDPHGANLTAFDETDRGWPVFMRVHPVIEWRYAEVWAFLRWMGVEYCELYDRGYTSLGGVGDTHPNPVLRVEEGGQDEDGKGEGAGEGRYRPAYELEEDAEERLGRDA